MPFLSQPLTGALACAVAIAAGCASPSFSDRGDDAGKPDAPDARSPSPQPSGPPDAQVEAAPSGCTGSTCASDAGQPPIDPGPGSDAALPTGAQPVDGKPAWAAAFEGTYAVRTRFYGREQPTQLVPFTHELVHLVDVHYDATSGRVSLDAALCEDHGDLLTTPPASVRVLYPDKVARRSFNVLYEEGFFRTEAPPLLTGWHEAEPAGCATASTAARSADQTWLTGGTCSCSSSDVPPTAKNDCRIEDSDGDGAPGQTIQVSGGFDDKNYVRVKDFSQFVRGVIASNGKHVAQFARNEDFYVLQCAGGGPCPRNSLDFCAVTEVLFEPLRALPASGKSWTCADVRAQKDACTFFGGCTPLTLPNGC